MPQPHIASGGRYPILRTIAILWLVSALLSLIGGVYQAICALIDARAQEVVLLHSSAMSSRVMAFFIWLAATFFVVVLSIAVAELIKLAIDVEHNTRMTSINLSPAASPEPVVRTGNGRTLEGESAEGALIRGH
jgi:hypothetical protein